jgi:hypothetical protein
MGGAVIASLYLTDSSPGYMQVLNGMGILWNINFMWLFTGIVTAFLISYSGIAYLRKNWLHQQLINELTINIGNTTLTVPAFLDTGNQLTDPITKTPVIVIETEALRQIIPEHILKKINEDDAQINELIASLDNENKDKGNKDKENGHKGNEDKGNEDKESEDKESKVKENGYKVNEGKENDEDTENDDLLLKDKDILNRIRLIPFNSVGRTHGLLVGLKPDNVVIKNRHKTFTTNNVVLGLVNRSLSKEGQYRALLHPLVFQDNM